MIRGHVLASRLKPPPDAGVRVWAAGPAVRSAPARGTRPSGIRVLGNRAMGQLQAKLAVGKPNDPYEREADSVADRVMRMPAPARSPSSASGEARARSELPHASLPAAVRSLHGGGRPLSSSERAFFEPRVGADFGAVRLHTDAAATRIADLLGARAFTAGRHVVLGAGEHASGTVRGRRLLAHELAHTVQQGVSQPHSSSMVDAAGPPPQPMIQRTEQDLDLLHDSALLDVPEVPALSRTPNPTASAPPAPLAPPPAGSFAPLTGTALADRRAHGMSTDAGPMLGQIETELFPTGGANPPCSPMPAGFRTTVATAVSGALRADVPSLTPTAAPNPMTVAAASAHEAMPIIHSYYSPHAPSVAPATFMARVSRKTTSYGDPIRTNDAHLAEFLEWYAGARGPLRTLTSNKCGMGTPWWTGFAAWLRGAGASFDANPHRIRERAALFDTYHTSVTSGGRIQFGLAFSLASIPHTVVHEAMHLFQHAALRTQVNRLPNLRSSRDIIIEGFAEYLARAVRDRVVDALQARTPPALTPAQETIARSAAAYAHYFDKAVRIRDILYRHGQNGEEAIRRAFFLGEGWRFGLLETATGVGSPIETDRAVPGPVDLRFTSGTTMANPGVLSPVLAYLNTRSIATAQVVGRTDPTGNPATHVALGQQRADVVKALMVAGGVAASRISATSRGMADQIAGGNSVNRRVTITVIDPRNLFPGLPGPGRP